MKKDYSALHMLLPVDEIAKGVAEILAEAESNTPPPPQAVADALLEMLTRESNPYWDPLQPEIRPVWSAGPRVAGLAWTWPRIDGLPWTRNWRMRWPFCC